MLNLVSSSARAVWRVRLAQPTRGVPSRTAASSSSSGSSDSNDHDFRPSEELAKERYEGRAGEDIERKRARLLYQSRKRGMLENGVILASFADKYLKEMDADQIDQYDRLINLPTNDWDIFYWATKTKPTPPEFETSVMQKLRNHLQSKVSKTNDSNPAKQDGRQAERPYQPPVFDKNDPSTLGPMFVGKGPDDIVEYPPNDEYPLVVDVSQVNLTDYKRELFDGRLKKLTPDHYVQNMTDWRKLEFERRLRRSISSPISVRNMSEEKESKVVTQRIPKTRIARGRVSRYDLLDSKRDRIMKHHNFLQYLLSSNFTKDPVDYDNEAEAWAEIMWHRDYGLADDAIAPSNKQCSSCNARIHCCDPGLAGYVPKELFASFHDPTRKVENPTCQRCKFSSVYHASLSGDVPTKDYASVISHLAEKPPSFIVYMVDLTDLPGSIWENISRLMGCGHIVVVVGNKLDLLPYDGANMINRVKNSLRRCIPRMKPGDPNIGLHDVIVLSARTGFGVKDLVTSLLALSENPRDFYLVGASNTGKSTLFNALLQSDFSAIRDTDLITRVSTYTWPTAQDKDLKLLRFPVNDVAGWEIQTKLRKSKIVQERREARESSFLETTRVRQATMPHMSMLINRKDYLPTRLEGALAESVDEAKLSLSPDHPLVGLPERDSLSATPEHFEHHAFLHHCPSASTPDQLHDLLTMNERLEVFPHETLVARKYSIRPLQSIFISGLARLDLLTSSSNVVVTVFVSKYLPIHVIETRKADHFYNTFLGSPYLGLPFGDEQRMRAWPGLSQAKGEKGQFHIRSAGFDCGAADIVLSSLGWALVSLLADQECIFRAFTPEARGIYLRDPPLLSLARTMVRGRKVRDTPLFEHPLYKTEQRSA